MNASLKNDLHCNMDKIIIKGLKVRANHGVLEKEKANGQFFFLDIVLDVDLSFAMATDELTDTVNYDEVCRVASDAMTANTYDLIERAAGDVMTALFEQFPPVQGIELTLKKPEAPLCRKVKYAAVSMYRTRGEMQLLMKGGEE